MKKIFTILAAVLLTVSVFAQSPEKMSYQAVIRNTSDQLVTNQAVGMQISILQGSATGTAVYVETQTPGTNANGLVSLEIGTGTVISGDFATIDWANDTYFIKTETDPTGGTSYTITGTSQLLSVPYALHAKTAESVTGTVNETDPVYTAWDKSTGISITESQISDLQTYLTAEVDGDASNEIQNLSQVLTQSNDAGTTQIKNLTDPTDAQDAATKAYVDLLETQIEELQILASLKVQDIDGNVYNIVTIGTQVWMAENLKTTKYPNGDAIPLVTDNTAWANLVDDNTSDAYSYYNNNASSEADTYGALYTYAAAIGDNWARDNTANQGVCPDGWHLPSDAEWTELTDFLGGTSVAGGKMKETGTAHWNSPNTAADNSSGFTGLPGGDRDGTTGSFTNLGRDGFFWSSTENSGSYTWRRRLYYSNATVSRGYGDKSGGFPVRCVKDN